MTFRTVGFELADWQQDAVGAWSTGASQPYTGTLEVFTGGGKTLMALQCAAVASREAPDLRLAIVVPTEALAHQWISSLRQHLEFVATSGSPTLFDGPETDGGKVSVGLLGAGGSDTLETHRVLVCVLNTAAKQLPAMARAAQPLMLVVDECHRAGAPSFSRVLDTPARFRLGLSATPEREEIDDDGEPLAFDEQLVGRKLGKVVARFSLRDARHMGWLPDYELHHHGVRLHEVERQRYDSISRQVDDLGDQLQNLGGEVSRARSFVRRDGDLGEVAKAYVTLTARRKDLLYRAEERARVAARIVQQEIDRGADRLLLFHERVDEATELHRELVALLPDVPMRLENSRLPDRERREAISAFRSGEANVLVSVKTLVEGIDVPEADVGISVASSSSVRQRVQSLGRVLRRSFDPDAPKTSARMHLLYVNDSVDDLIYGKEDWEDLTGEGANLYWLWPLDPAEDPEPQNGPPRTPRPTEEQEWERLGGKAPESPERWHGVLSGQEYSADTMGAITNSSGSMISNPQGVAEMVAAVRGRPGGRFRVTPMHRIVLVSGEIDGASGWFAAGALGEPFETLEDTNPDDGDDGGADPADPAALRPGDPLPGKGNRSGGTFQLKQRKGGVIARKVRGGTDFALVDGSGSPALEANAVTILEAWRQLLDRGVTFYVDDREMAWYAEGSGRRFLGHVPGGFAWPED